MHREPRHVPLTNYSSICDVVQFALPLLSSIQVWLSRAINFTVQPVSLSHNIARKICWSVNCSMFIVWLTLFTFKVVNDTKVTLLVEISTHTCEPLTCVVAMLPHSLKNHPFAWRVLFVDFHQKQANYYYRRSFIGTEPRYGMPVTCTKTAENPHKTFQCFRSQSALTRFRATRDPFSEKSLLSNGNVYTRFAVFLLLPLVYH